MPQRPGPAGADRDEAARPPAAALLDEVFGQPRRPVEVTLDDQVMPGLLISPAGRRGIVVFGHHRAGDRHSGRSRLLAAALNQVGIGALLVDLAGAANQAGREPSHPAGAREDPADRGAAAEEALPPGPQCTPATLADRLAHTVSWLRGQPEAAGQPIGLAGVGVGAAAAVVTAIRLASQVSAVVCRGGRIDLVEDHLSQLTSPTLLIVGGLDADGLAACRLAHAKLRCTNRLHVVPGASGRFTEPGAMRQVVQATRTWFSRYLRPIAAGRVTGGYPPATALS